MKTQLSIIKYLMTLLAVTLLLTACGGGGGGGGGGNNQTTNNIPATNPLKVPNISGTTTALDGWWYIPCDSVTTAGTVGVVTNIKFKGSVVTVVDAVWNDDKLCNGAPDSVTKYSGTAILDTNSYAIDGWITFTLNSSNVVELVPATSPNAADGSGPLSNTESYFSMQFTVTSSENPKIPVGVVAQYNFVVDDTGPTPILYRVWYSKTLGNVAATNMDFEVPGSLNAKVFIASALGSSLGLYGPYTTGCGAAGGGSTIASFSMAGTNGTQWRTDSSTYNTNTSCAGTSDSQVKLAGDTSIGTTQRIAGWVNAFGAPSNPPQALDGSGPLPITAKYTPLTVTITESILDPALVGTKIPYFYVVDDSVPAIPLIYIGNPSDSTAKNFAPFSPYDLH